MNPFQAFQTKNEFQTIDPQRIGGILKSGDGVQMSVLSFGTTLLKHSLPEMVIFPNKTTPFPPSLVVDPWRIGVILTSGDGVSFIIWKNLTCCMKLYQVRMNSF